MSIFSNEKDCVCKCGYDQNTYAESFGNDDDIKKCTKCNNFTTEDGIYSCKKFNNSIFNKNVGM